MAKKKVDVATASVSSTEAFPMMELALQLDVPTTWQPVSLTRRWRRSARTLAWMAGWRWWRLVSSCRWWRPRQRLHETLTTTSRVLNPYENPVT
jgi:hypothetical protein